MIQVLKEYTKTSTVYYVILVEDTIKVGCPTLQITVKKNGFVTICDTAIRMIPPTMTCFEASPKDIISLREHIWKFLKEEGYDTLL